MAYEIKNPNDPASNKQLWALFCITKKDHRGLGLTKGEASDLIAELGGKKKSNGKKATPKKNEFVELYEKAFAAGLAALKACTPVPMVVSEHENMFDDKLLPVKKSWYVADGACGFAWVNVKCKGAGHKFINAMKKHAADRWGKDGYYGGYTFWVREGNQSIMKKEAFANAFADVLREGGINCYASSRLD